MFDNLEDCHIMFINGQCRLYIEGGGFYGKLERVTYTNNWSKVLCKLGGLLLCSILCKAPFSVLFFLEIPKAGPFLCVFSK